MKLTLKLSKYYYLLSFLLDAWIRKHISVSRFTTDLQGAVNPSGPTIILPLLIYLISARGAASIFYYTLHSAVCWWEKREGNGVIFLCSHSMYTFYMSVCFPQTFPLFLKHENLEIIFCCRQSLNRYYYF